MSKFTKLAIINSFMKLLSKMPFDKITVMDIVADCGIHRNTFYYHYRDIYELVDEIMQNEVNRITSEHKIPYTSWSEGLLSAVEFAVKNKRAIYHLHNSVKRPQLIGYMEKTIYGVVSEFVGIKSQNRGISSDDLDFISRFYTFALLGMMERWIDSGMKEDIYEVIRKTGILFDVNIDHALDAVTNKRGEIV